jgi:predicted house-cleaning noncanonical NTP pyrophosphatase (MazG superfamily)
LHEELREFNKDKNEEEFADIREVVEEVLDFLEDYYGLDKKKVASVKKRKAVKNGKFKERIILEQV